MNPRLLLALGSWLSAITAAPAAGATVTFLWDPTPAPDYLIRGYTVTIATNSGTWSTNLETMGRTTCTVTLSNQLAPGCYRATVRAIDTNGIPSVPSNAVDFALPPPPQLRIQAWLESAADPAGPWTELAALPPVDIAADAARQYYRIRADIR